MLRLLVGGLIGAALAYYLDPKSGRKRRESAMVRLDAQGLAARDEFDRVKERVHENWSAITDKDVEMARGNIDALVRLIGARTGETVEAIREQLYSHRPTQSAVLAR